MKKYEKHQQICEKLNNVYISKNTEYGDSFGKTFQELGVISAVTRMQDKFNRIKKLATNSDMNIVHESMADSLEDLANYCIMTLIELDNKEEVEVLCLD